MHGSLCKGKTPDDSQFQIALASSLRHDSLSENLLPSQRDSSEGHVQFNPAWQGTSLVSEQNQFDLKYPVNPGWVEQIPTVLTGESPLSYNKFRLISFSCR